RLSARENQLIFLRVDVVRNDKDVELVAQPFAERLNERRLAGADRTTDADAEWGCHERNSLVYWVSCDIDARSSINAADPRSSMLAVMACSPPSSIASSSSAIARWPS